MAGALPFARIGRRSRISLVASREGSDRLGLVGLKVAQEPEQPLLDRVELETALHAFHVWNREVGPEFEVAPALRARSEPERHAAFPRSRAGDCLRV